MANFTKARKLFTEALTFSRALGTFQPDADGLYYAVDTDEPRFSAGGLAIESASENEIWHCRDMSNGAAWGVNGTITRARNAVGITGSANTASTLTVTAGAITSTVYQGVTIASTDQNIVASVFVLKTTGATIHPMFQLILGPSLRASAFVINTNTGVATNISSQGANGTCTVGDFGDFWRVVIVLQNTSADTGATMHIWPAASNNGTGHQTNLTGSCVVDFAMIEQGRSAASSPISTTTATVTRPSESAVNALFSTWGRQQFFTLLVEIDGFEMTPAGGDILSLYKVGTDRIRISSDPGSGGRFALISAMDTGGNKTRYFTATRSAKIAISSSGYSAGGGVIKAVNGVSATDNITSSVYSDITSLGIGRGQATTNAPQSLTIKRIEFWPKLMTAAELEALTAP